jgi:hypothetical protein
LIGPPQESQRGERDVDRPDRSPDGEPDLALFLSIAAGCLDGEQVLALGQIVDCD